MQTLIEENEILETETEVEIDKEENFSSLNLSHYTMLAIVDMKFTKPSSIQQEAIPQIISGNDIIAKAPTGSGKTAAFAIPIIEKLDLSAKNKSVQSLVLCPTRELAIQVHKEFEKLTKYYEDVSVVSVYGGQNIEKQLGALKRKPQIIVATPGRLMDHMNRGSIKLDAVKSVVLDEADEMLDMGFREDIHSILETTPEERQTILFSATMAKNILEITQKFQKHPNIVDVTDNVVDIPNIEQKYFEVSEKEKNELLTRLLVLHNIKLALVFCNTKSNVDKVVELLKTKGFFADAIHGDMNQTQREKVMRGFKKGSIKILVATDVAGRGIDVKNLEAVFNYDMPRDDEDYTHRIGRTARAGQSGVAFTFVTGRQSQSIKRIERANGIQIHKQALPSVEAIEAAETVLFEEKVQAIIESEDLSSQKERIESMINDEMSLLDISAALLKLASSKVGKKINKSMIFEEPKEDRKQSSKTRRKPRNDKRVKNSTKERSDSKSRYKKSDKKDGRKKKQNKAEEIFFFEDKKPSKNKKRKPAKDNAKNKIKAKNNKEGKKDAKPRKINKNK